MTIYKLIENSINNDKRSLNELIIKFEPLIKKYSNLLNYDDAESELIMFFIQLILKIPIEKASFKNEGVLISYIQKSVRNKYIYLSKKYSLIVNKEIELNTDIKYEMNTTVQEDKILIKEILSILSEKERQILILRYLKQYSDLEIANMFNVSRQYICKVRVKALKKAKKFAAS